MPVAGWVEEERTKRSDCYEVDDIDGRWTEVPSNKRRKPITTKLAEEAMETCLFEDDFLDITIDGYGTSLSSSEANVVKRWSSPVLVRRIRAS